MFENIDFNALKMCIRDRPCICYAIYTYDKSGFYHNPYFQRKSDGAKMGRCIAWRKSLKEA